MLGFLLERLRAAADRRLPQHLRDARRGEQMAYEYLRKNGYKIVARNYRPRHGRGEVDLVGWNEERLAFVEVKARKNEDFGRPEQAVDRDKRGRLIRVSREYARRAGIEPERIRFDVVSIVWETPPRIELYKAAFTVRGERQRWRPAVRVSSRASRQPQAKAGEPIRGDSSDPDGSGTNLA
jgi:putative endonuclease